jgi:UV DNA damage endonuclease
MIKRLYNYLRITPHIKYLEIEWGKYKYLILERSPDNYQKIRLLLTKKEEYPVEQFYRLIDESLEIPVTQNHFINAASHVFGYFKKTASAEEKTIYTNYLEHYVMTPSVMNELKHFLYQLSFKYHEKYLIDSHYFIDLYYRKG